MIVYKGEEYFKYKTTKWTKHYASKSGKLIFQKLNTNEILETTISLDGRGYKRCVNGQVHIIVAKLFIENLENKKYVNHKDGNKFNNHFENLEWCTQSENTKHAYDNNLIDNSNRKTPIVIVRFNKVYEFEDTYVARNYCKENFKVNILNWIYRREIPKRFKEEFQFVGYKNEYKGDF